MRVVLAGSAAARAGVRRDLAAAGMDIVGETATLGEAGAAGFTADAFVVVPDRTGTADEAPADPLTRRELDVLGLLADGLPNKAIAIRLGISDQTVKFHVAAIAGKLGAANRTDAVRRAIRQGIVSV